MPTQYIFTRLGGSYLKNNAGGFILTKSGNKIIIKTKGGNLKMTSYTVRPTI